MSEKLKSNKLHSWLLIFIIVVLVILVNVFLAIKTINQLSNTQSALYNTGEMLTNLDELHIMVLSAETGQRGYLLTEIDEYLTPYLSTLDSVAKQIKTVRHLKSDIPRQTEKIEVLTHLIEEKIAELIKTVDLALADKEKKAIKLVMAGRGRNLYREIKELFDNLKSLEIIYRNGLYAQLTAIEKEAKVTFTISAITSFLLLIGMMVLAVVIFNREKKHLLTLENQNNELETQVKIKTEALTLYSEELEQSNRELESFAFVASHDLQEPLRKIRAFGDRLETNYAEQLDERGADFINRMKNAAERMSNLISDLLAYSRISTRGNSFVDCSLTTTIDEVIDDLQIAIEECNADITYDNMPIISADKSQMNQLFLNLISNAIKFRKPDNTAPKIKITYLETAIYNNILNKNEAWHVINVSDNGIGFEQAYEDKIFTPFQRLHSRTQYKGTGIGLAVCRRIVERHGGVISAKSELNVGTCFTLQLPKNYTLSESNGAQKNVL